MRLIALIVALIWLGLADPASAQENRVVLRFTAATGNDDLRGGGDNLYAVVTIGGRETRHLLNQRPMRWADHTSHVTNVLLPSNFRLADLSGIRLETSFRGGIDGDNWNMDSMLVQIAPRSGEGTPLTLVRHGFFRFTGDRRSLTLRLNPELPRERVK